MILSRDERPPSIPEKNFLTRAGVVRDAGYSTVALPLNLKTSTYHALMRAYNIKDCLDQVHRFLESQCRA
jgi:hypothetical protein